jgi:EAL domain-containing protein (putative c-di-GMP-specific phosphodiesterase class I)
MDDFGTGYSSLAYLKRFPLDILKVDQSFVRNAISDHGDAAIVRTVVAMAHSFGMKVIAEGVETEAHLTFLSGLGCEYYQGYLFSKPLPAQDVARLLSGESSS